MVPVSSSQVIIGCIIGIGLYKGVRNINFRILGEISAGWVATPIFSGLLAFVSLFFIKNLFGIEVGTKSDSLIESVHLAPADNNISDIMKYLILGLLVAGVIAILLYYFLERKKKIELQKSEEKFWKNIK
jgi:phosphate/sulfate permease